MIKLDKMFEKHDDELEYLKNSLYSIQTNLQLLMQDHAYLGKLVEEIKIDLSSVKDNQKDLRQNINNFKNYMESRANILHWMSSNWWKLLMFIMLFGSSLWGIMDFFYRLPPPQ